MATRSAISKILASYEVVIALVLRELSIITDVRKGGYFWLLFEPVASVTLLTVVFSLALRQPSLGYNFALFYASAYLPFYYFRQIQNSVATAFKFNRSVIAFPKVTWVDLILSRIITSTLVNLSTSLLILVAIFWVYEIRARVDIVVILMAFALSGLFGASIGILNIVLFHYVPTFQRIYNVLTTPLFIISAVLYIYEDLGKVAQSVLWFNPLVHIHGFSRSGFYVYYHPYYISLEYVVVLSLIICCLGTALIFILFRRIVQ